MIGTGGKFTFQSRYALVALAFVISIFVLNVYRSAPSNPVAPPLPYDCRSHTNHILQSDKHEKILNDIRTYHLSFLSRCSLQQLMTKIISLECDPSTPTNAVMVEAGVAAGGSAIAFTSVKRPHRLFYLYDTFQGMPPPSERDGPDVHRRYQEIQANKGNNDGYYGNIENLRQYVENKFKQLGFPINTHRVLMKRGLFQDTIPTREDTPVMFVNIDGDWYDSVYTVLDRIAKRVTPGGIVYIDDYNTYSGATNATDDFLAEKRNKGRWKISRVNCPEGRLVLTRLSSSS